VGRNPKIKVFQSFVGQMVSLSRVLRENLKVGRESVKKSLRGKSRQEGSAQVNDVFRA